MHSNIRLAFLGRVARIRIPPVRIRIQARGVRVVGADGWVAIDAEEKKRGAAVGKPREKIVEVEELLAAAGV